MQMLQKIDTVSILSNTLKFLFFAACLLTLFSFVRHSLSKTWQIEAHEVDFGGDVSGDFSRAEQQVESGEHKNENVLAAFSVFIVSPTPTNTPTPTIMPTNTPTPTLLPTETPMPTPVPPTAIPTLTPTPLPTRVPASPADIDGFFTKYSQEYAVEVDLLRKIAYCESGYNSQSTNGVYGGMYQFHTDSWVSVRTAMSADTNPDLRFNPEEAIKTAAYKISVHGTSAWPACSK
jgi:hypothetical protein